MSDMNDVSPSRPAAGPARVFGTMLTLLIVLGGLAWVVLGALSAPVDGAAKQVELFGERPLPFGLVLDSAARLSVGSTHVRFVRSAEEGPGPTDVLFFEYGGRSPVEALFRRPKEESSFGEGEESAGSQLERWEQDPSFAWHTTVKRDEIAWGDWSTKLRIERSFREGGGWSEEAMVDVSTPGRALVLFAHWPLEVPVDEDELRLILQAVEFPAEEDSAADKTSGG